MENKELKANVNSEMINLLEGSAQEIERLRRQNREQGLRLQMFDDMMQVLNTEPRRWGAINGGEEDMVYKLRKQISILENP